MSLMQVAWLFLVIGCACVYIGHKSQTVGVIMHMGVVFGLMVGISATVIVLHA